MARVCDNCGKKPVTTNTGRHNTTKNISAHGGWAFRAVKTKKRVIPNLRKVRVNSMRPIKVCMSCYKSPAFAIIRESTKIPKAELVSVQ